LAASELPSDVSGARSEGLCNGDVFEGPTPRLTAMAEQRERIVRAIDATAPTSSHDGLDRFLKALVPFYDPPEEVLPSQTRALAALLTSLSEDPEALNALERISHRRGYRPLARALGIARPALSYPRLRELTTTVLDATSPSGAAELEWRELLSASALTMGLAEPSAPEDGQSTLELTQNLLLQTDDRFGYGTTTFLTRRDRRGIAQPMPLGGVTVPAPFIDRDSNGLADVDPLGRFVDTDGSLLDLPTPFAVDLDDSSARDGAGRAVRSGGEPYFRTTDMGDSFLAGLTRMSVPLLDGTEPALFDALFAMRPLLGPPSAREEEVLPGFPVRFEGFDPAESPLLDIVHATTTNLRDPAIDDVLALVHEMLASHESEVAGLAESGLVGRAAADLYPDVALAQESDLFDDQLVVLGRIARTPGLMEAVLRALANPASKRLGHIFGEMMRYGDTPTISEDEINASLRETPWTGEVNALMPEGDDDNRSLFQQSLSIIHDLSGVRLCNKAGARLGITLGGRYIRLPLTYDECELLEIEDVGVTFQEAILGRARIEIKSAFLSGVLELGGAIGLGAGDVLQRESGIDGLTTEPTPQALSRLVFAPRNEFMRDLIEPPLTRDGVPIEERHNAVVLAWEREFRFCGDALVDPLTPCAAPEDTSFYEAMGPLLRAFDDFDPRETNDLFSEIVSATHLHWSSPDDPRSQSEGVNAPFFSHQDNGRRYEPIMSTLFSECLPQGSRCVPAGAGQLISRLHEFLRAADGIEVRPGVDGIAALARAGESLFDSERSPGLVGRNGRGTSNRSSGTGVLPVTPMLLMTDAMARTETVWAESPESRDAWRSARSHMADAFLSTTGQDGARRFSDGRFVAVTQTLIRFIRDRVAFHRDAGDLDSWSRELYADIEDAVDSPLGASSLRFLQAVQDDAETTEELSRFLGYMVREDSFGDAWRDVLLAVGDMLQVQGDEEAFLPLLHFFAEALAPGILDQIATAPSLRLSDIQSEGSVLDATMLLMRRANEVDEDDALSTLLANLVTLPEGESETPIEVLIDAMAEIYRVDPGAGGPLFRDDYGVILDNATEFLSDEDHGLERIYRVVQERELRP
ncbi:MAG: hypothetical protein ACI9KE_004626, partial [Polyangiales bacterium]